MQILISYPSLEIPPACFTWGTWSHWWVLGPGKAPLEQRQLKSTSCSLCVWTQTTLSHRGLKITFWTAVEFSCVTIGGGMREYGCCRSGAPWNLNHPLFFYMRGVRKALSVCSDPSTAHLLQGVFPTMWLGGSSPTSTLWALVQPPQWSMVVGTHVVYIHGQLQKSSSVPSPHLLMEELKQWYNLRNWISSQLLQEGRKELVSSPHPEIGWPGAWFC